MQKRLCLAYINLGIDGGIMENKLKWNVYVCNQNRRRIEEFNIFDHSKFLESINSYKTENSSTLPKMEDFYSFLKDELMYYFWGKCEYEVILSSWPPDEKCSDIKVDVFQQVMLNFDKFSTYVYEYLFMDEKERTPEQVVFGKTREELQDELVFWILDDMIETVLFDHLEEDGVDENGVMIYKIYGNFDSQFGKEATCLGTIEETAYGDYIFDDYVEACKRVIELYEKNGEDNKS